MAIFWPHFLNLDNLFLILSLSEVMKENTRLLVLTGVHGQQSGEIGGKDNGFVRDSRGQIDLLKGKYKADIVAGKITMEVEDVGLHNASDTSTKKLDEEKFVEAVKKFKPTVLVLAFCWSHKSELNNLLREAGIYSTLILREELAQITESRHVHLDEDQKNLIQRIAEEKPKNVFLWGTSGSGKTLMLAEALKMKISKLRREGKQDVRVIVAAMFGRDALMKDIQEKYLPDIAKESFMNLAELAKKLNVKYDNEHPQSLMKDIFAAEDSQSSSHTIILVDEVAPMSKEEQENNTGKAKD